MATPKSIALIITSTREARIGPSVAALVKSILENHSDPSETSLTLVDLVKFNLPVYDEGCHPAMVPFKAQFQHEHSKAWSAEIKKHDGYVLVIPEYNYSLSGGTKNAIDYLMNEWKGKPVAVISYGIHGGKHASDTAYEVLSQMGLRVAPTRPQLGFHDGAGPDMFLAMAGKLGDDTKKQIEGQEAEIAKAWDELKRALTDKDLYVRPRAW
ncbi:flavo protein-like protein [Fusarium oxysporum Fo47]|uniref:NADPH-dependent FMN reductase-like domain-containing protein n=2 Tax=Fusarium oxysporum TaxID=5507 RepID=A0A8H5AIJ0_FUSOX|nr:flavo protein-like protein [Fusarium oxysporum Fo47]EWZ33058.1 hypothetical protein FOZG_14553 [Fusarium oxysporum Fo47]KAF5263955.1 hypothetical protein FOXYS1_5273 [Fusarium oxysporum]QKD60196.1 flavo protein-like protein [Fusarium oxysporum Fo47]